MAEIKKLSSSKITTYKGCPFAYYLKYEKHEKIPTNVRYAFGKGIHYMLEEFYKKNYKSPESFGNFWKYYWGMLASGENLKGKQKRQLKLNEFPMKNGNVLKLGDHIDYGNDPAGVFFGYMKLGEDILKKFYKRHISEKDPENKSRKIPIAIEKGFGVKKNEPFRINGINMIGYIDRIDRDFKGKYFISDYKTDKKTPEDGAFILHRHPQFTLYSYAFRELFQEKEEAILYYHLRSGKVFKSHRNEKDYDYMKRLIDDVAEGITQDRFTPFYGFHCNFCDYKVACGKYSFEYQEGPRKDLGNKTRIANEFKDWDIDPPGPLNGFLED